MYTQGCNQCFSTRGEGVDYAHPLALPHLKRFRDYDPGTALPVEIKMILLIKGHLPFFLSIVALYEDFNLLLHNY